MQYTKSVNNAHWLTCVTSNQFADSVAWAVLGQHLGPHDSPRLTGLIACDEHEVVPGTGTAEEPLEAGDEVVVRCPAGGEGREAEVGEARGEV